MLSNGQVFRNAASAHVGQDRLILTSFNSLAPGRHFQTNTSVGALCKRAYRFDSLSPGRHFRTGYYHYKDITRGQFPFPFTGKAFPNLGRVGASPFIEQKVSIPFNREGISELENGCRCTQSSPRFHSLQPGRHFRTHCSLAKKLRRKIFGFHSLQSGRHFRTIKAADQSRNGRSSFPFPSTGKAFPNLVFELAVEENYESFPFPSTGKAFPNPYAFKPLCASVSKSQLQTRIKLVIFLLMIPHIEGNVKFF